MTYNKPEVITLDRAAKAIQGNNGKPNGLFQDSRFPTEKAMTPAAYEADE